MLQTLPSFCRFCHCNCPIRVDVEDGRAVKVRGIPENPVYHGFTCPKGRALPAAHNHPDRLHHSMKRMPDGSYQSIAVDQAMDEIAERLRGILAEHGPRSTAVYYGTMSSYSHPATSSMATAWMNAIGSPMRFTTVTIDSPGAFVAQMLHGIWKAPAQNFDRPEVGLLIGVNPIVANSMGAPTGNPGMWLKRQKERGFKLIVIDPRKTETARRADLHLQCRPGHDAAILAAMIHVLLAERLTDEMFVREEVDGVEALRRAVEPFTPERVAAKAGLAEADLVEAARMWGRAKRGYAVPGTGPSMSGGGTTLIAYLSLCMLTLCGRWMRAGEQAPYPGVLSPEARPKAQALPLKQAYGFGEKMRVRGLADSAAGLPTAALADEMLLDGDGRVRALISMGGNPVSAWPDQLKTIAALEKADLVVQVDTRMSTTARRADYVIATKMCLELPGMTRGVENLSMKGIANGYPAPWAQVAEAVTDVPPGSDLVTDWELYYGLAQRMGVTLALNGNPLNMAVKPTDRELIDLLAQGSRVPIDDVRAQPEGGLFPGDPVHVAAKDSDCTARLDVGNAEMMADLGALAGSLEASAPGEPRGFRLISRRMPNVYNSVGQDIPELWSKSGRGNPAYLHPDDLEALGIASGDLVEIRSDHAAIVAVAEADPSLRREVVSMSHAFGDGPERDSEVRTIGANTGRLMSTDRDWDRYTGMPRMSNVPVSVTKKSDA